MAGTLLFLMSRSVGPARPGQTSNGRDITAMTGKLSDHCYGGISMGRFLKIAIPMFVIGFLAGNAFWYLASPLWIDQEVSESLAGEDTLELVASGTFVDADRLHKGQGTATIFQNPDGSYVLRLTEFEVTNGPDLEVWLSSAADPTKSSDVSGGTWLALGQLKGNIGDQNYDIPAGTNITDFGSVVIWCEQFGVLFSPASLAFG